MAKRKKQRGRKPKANPSIIFRLTLSLDPIEHAPVIAFLNSVPAGQRSGRVVDALMGQTTITIGGARVEQVPQEENTAEREVYIADDGW